MAFPKNISHEKSFEGQLAGTRPFNSHWFEIAGQKFGPWNNIVWTKMDSPQDGACVRYLLKGVVALTCTLVCGDL